ncbi:MAG: DUF1036 domain-containing protein [Bauldia sp.]
MGHLPIFRRVVKVCAAGAVALGAGTPVLLATPAAADFTICNTTTSRVGVSIGYRDGDMWTTEGWWNITAGDCSTIVSGPLSSRFYYVYAVDYDQPGAWTGNAFMCTQDLEFTIRGIEDCVARGYERTGFVEVDTANQANWLVYLSEENRTGIGGE